MTRYEGARFSDGSVAIRRISEDPCERATRTFESVHECNEDLGREDLIMWMVDEVPKPAPPRVVGRGVDALFGDLPAGCVPIYGDAGLIGFTNGGQERAGSLSRRVRGGWQLHDLATGQELRPAYEPDPNEPEEG